MIHDMIMAAAGAGGAAGPTDADFENTVLLLHGDGTNGAQNNTFIDSSTNAFTITRNGNTTQGTFSPFSKPDGRWGIYVNGATSDAIQAPNNAVFDYGSGDVTVEAWIYLSAVGSIQTLIDSSPTGGSGFTSWAFDITDSNYIRFISYISGNLELYTATSNPLSANEWYHIAYTRSSGTDYLFVNGVACTATGGISQQINTGGNPVTIGRGRYVGFERPSTGYFSNVRITKGGALYTSGFTPSTTPLTTTVSVGTVSLLTCQSNRFVDKSVNAFAITVLATPRVTPFSPFPITTAYSTSVNGGAGYFDGSGDYLTAPTDAAFAVGSVFTIEFWLYPQAYGANPVFIFLGESSGDLQFGLNSGNLGVAASGVAWRLTGSAGPTLNAWNHCVLVRSGTGSNQTSIFLNGTRIVNGTVTDAWTTNKPAIIQSTAGSSYETQGYMASVRIVKGTAVYDPSQTTITVPTAPLTAISNTSLLTNFTNAGIFDNTGFNALETVGNAQIDTTTKKYGTGSMEFDGTDDELVAVGGPQFDFGAGPFTVEFWINTTSATSQIVAAYSDIGGASNTNWVFSHSVSTAGKMYFSASDGSTFQVSLLASTTSINDGAWHHIAVVRSGSTFTMYVDGTSEGTATWSGSISSTTRKMRLGWNGNGNYFNGFLDDFRVTKGKARYTSNFTPPTAAFPDIGA